MQLCDHDIRDHQFASKTQRKSNKLVRPKKMPKMHGGSLKKFCPLLLSAFSWFHKTRKEKKCEWRAVTIATADIFQTSSSSIHVAASISSFAALSTSTIPTLRFFTLRQVNFFSLASYLNLITTSVRGTDSSHDLMATIRSKCATWKNPREDKETKARKDSFMESPLFLPAVFRIPLE